MSENKKIIDKFKKNLKKLKKHNKLYFSDDNPEITDSEYDKIKKEVLEQRKKYDFLKVVSYLY